MASSATNLAKRLGYLDRCRRIPRHYRGCADRDPTYTPATVAYKANGTERTRFANRLQALRLRAGLTQAEAANATGVGYGAWGNWESGRHLPALTRGGAIARALDVPLEALFIEDGFCPLPVFVLSPESLRRLAHKPSREAVLDELTAVLSGHLRAALEQAEPLKPAPRRRRRRTREEVLAAQASSLAKLRREHPAKRKTPRTIS